MLFLRWRSPKACASPVHCIGPPRCRPTSGSAGANPRAENPRDADCDRCLNRGGSSAGFMHSVYDTRTGQRLGLALFVDHDVLDVDVPDGMPFARFLGPENV